MTKPAARHAPAAAAPAAVIGRPQPLLDGADKLSGRARYTADLPFPGALVARIGRSQVAHGHIRRIDASRARALPGVRAVITGDDFSAPCGVLPGAADEWPLARARVRYRGEPLFAVAADDIDTAEAALRAVEVEIEPLPAYFDAAAARAAGAVRLHDDQPYNLAQAVEHAVGDVDAGFAAADLVLEHDFDCAELAHGQLELDASVAQWDAERAQLTLHAPTQVPTLLQRALAQTLGLAPAQVRVIKPFVGGSFGHHAQPLNHELVAAALARAAGGTVKLELSREEVFLTHRGRPHTQLRLKIGATRDGRLTAVDAALVQGGGAYAGWGLATLLRTGALLHALYRIDALRFRGERVYTNLPPCGAMRAQGAANLCFAFEALLDELATGLQLDPFALRRANLLEPAPQRVPNELQPDAYGLPACLDAVERASGWRRARRAPAPAGSARRRGRGLACSHYPSAAALPAAGGSGPHAVVQLRLDFDGSITLLTGAAELGQGAATLLALVVAEELQLPLARIRVVAADTALVPSDAGGCSSWLSFAVGNAALRAAQALKQALVDAAARRLEVAPAQLQWQGERCAVAGSDRELAFAQVLQAALAEAGTLTVNGAWSPPAPGNASVAGASDASDACSYAAQVAEVEVDTDTGVVRVLQLWVAHDCGRALNPLAVDGQVQGAVWMGLGQALSEQTQYFHGLPLRPNFFDYRMVSIVDAPQLHVQRVEHPDARGPFGAKAAGAAVLPGVAPAVAAAIFDAVGLRLRALPLTPERVLEALQQQRREQPPRAAPARRAARGAARS